MIDSSLGSGMPAKALAFRVTSAAPALAAVTPIAVSAARFLGEPRLRPGPAHRQRMDEEVDIEMYER